MDYEIVENAMRGGIEWLRLLVEGLGALGVAVGVALSVVVLLRAGGPAFAARFTRGRLTRARFLALALELQLAADILATMIAPSGEQIGKLAAVAIIRTGLNFFLAREMSHESDELGAEERAEAGRV